MPFLSFFNNFVTIILFLPFQFKSKCNFVKHNSKLFICIKPQHNNDWVLSSICLNEFLLINYFSHCQIKTFFLVDDKMLWHVRKQVLPTANYNINTFYTIVMNSTWIRFRYIITTFQHEKNSEELFCSNLENNWGFENT